MRIRSIAVIASVAGALLLSVSPSADATSVVRDHTRPAPLPAHAEHAVCAAPAAGRASCHAHVVTSKDGAAPLASSSYTYGFRPADLQAVYALGTGTGTPTVAIVDAYDNPNVALDLSVYRRQFGLPLCAGADAVTPAATDVTSCGILKKVSQTGSTTSYPTSNVGWGQEIALDVEMVSAICPNCKTLLVEASTNSYTNLMAAVDYAAAHASYVSNSYGGTEFSTETGYESHFNHAGVAFTVSSGDNGYGVEYPAASKYVTAVGGTSLTVDATTGARTSETAWSGAGSGCSAYIGKPSWQADTGCARRTVADVSAVADPNTGVAVYDSYGSTGGNWYVFGGTSVAAPIVAAVYALAGPIGSTDFAAQYPYAHASSLFDVVSGTNGTCSTAYLCAAVTGFDGPTGLGAPITSAAFAPGTSGTTPPANQPPTVTVAKSCSGTSSCSFTATGIDKDGTVVKYVWANVSTSSDNKATATYRGTGTYTHSVTVTDDKGATGSGSTTVKCSYVRVGGKRKLSCV